MVPPSTPLTYLPIPKQYVPLAVEGSPNEGLHFDPPDCRRDSLHQECDLCFIIRTSMSRVRGACKKDLASILSLDQPTGDQKGKATTTSKRRRPHMITGSRKK